MSKVIRTWTLASRRPARMLRMVGRDLWRQWRVTVFVVLFVVVPVKSSLADWNWVPTGSMNPTILEGDLVYVDKLAYDLRFPLTLHRLARWSEPQRGDVVVCLSPDDGTRLVKRVIARPDDTVELRNNVLLLNGRPLAYDKAAVDYAGRLPHNLPGKCIVAMENLDSTVHPVLSIPAIRAMRNFGPVTVPDGHYFVMGDNRDISRDSRFFGFVPRKAILGKARAVILSFDITDKYQPRFGRFLSRLR
ncbi:MAG: signal peptidase I [Sedimentisphaerales bacterium]|nr:signal peptidase I [Sedimentisphaerales bacterium]